MSGMAGRVLSERDAALLAEERRLLADLRAVVGEFDGTPEDLEALQRAALDLDELFLLVVAGEFNAGKSSVINALAGERVMPEGVTPTTTAVTLLRYGDRESETARSGDVVERRLPAAFLREITIVDTPGTNAVIRRHEEITRQFVPRADLVLFVTSVDRPFTESERDFLEVIRDWGKKIVIVVNKVDLVGDDDLVKVLDFVAGNAQALLGTRPEIFPVAARPAYAAKQADDPAERARLQAAGRLEPLERYIFGTLDERSRLQLKLLSPLGVAERLKTRYLTAADARLGLLREDFKTTENIEAQLGVHVEDMRREFKLRLSDIDNTLHALTERGDRFFDETLRLTRALELLNRDRIRQSFESEVLADSAQAIDGHVQSLIDWMVEQELRLWQGVMDYLNRRRQSQANEHMIGDIGATFDYNRRELLQTVARKAREVVESYDRRAEATALAEEMQSAVTQVGLTAVGAVSLGTLIALLVGGAAADVTGLLAAVTLGGLGLFILPAKKRRAKAQFHQRVDELRERLHKSMTDQFESELNRSLGRLRDAIAPYTRFVRAEHEKVTGVHARLTELGAQGESLRASIDGLDGAAPRPAIARPAEGA